MDWKARDKFNVFLYKIKSFLKFDFAHFTTESGSVTLCSDFGGMWKGM